MAAGFEAAGTERPVLADILHLPASRGLSLRFQLAAIPYCSYSFQKGKVRGVPIVSTCTQPMGMFVAQTVAELKDYAKQLHSRLLGNGKRFAAINRIIRAKVAKESVEPDGQRRLCFT